MYYTNSDFFFLFFTVYERCYARMVHNINSKFEHSLVHAQPVHEPRSLAVCLWLLLGLNIVYMNSKDLLLGLNIVYMNSKHLGKTEHGHSRA